MLLAHWPMTAVLMYVFQSSSNPKVGCYTPGVAGNICLHCFNPHPTRRLDATDRAVESPEFWAFQSSSNPKVGCYERWVQVQRIAPLSFNPHPTRRFDATV